jgi:hypothetical protein
MSSYSLILRDGKVDEHRSLQENRVTKIEETTMAPSLFEVPAGYKRVNSLKE